MRTRIGLAELITVTGRVTAGYKPDLPVRLDAAQSPLAPRTHEAKPLRGLSIDKVRIDTKFPAISGRELSTATDCDTKYDKTVRRVTRQAIVKATFGP